MVLELIGQLEKSVSNRRLPVDEWMREPEVIQQDLWHDLQPLIDQEYSGFHGPIAQTMRKPMPPRRTVGGNRSRAADRQ